MKFDKRGIENILRNFFYADTHIEHCCKQTCHDIWGKEIITVDKDKCVNRGKLETWLFTVDIDCENTTLDSIQEFCHNLAQKATEYEKEQLGNRNAANCTCYMLYDWQFLENEVGGIINNGKVTLVKYAKILGDMENGV